MQAIIMAAGRGSRLGDITAGIPKSFLEVEGIKLLEYNLALLRDIGVNSIVVVTGYQAEAIEELLTSLDYVQCVFNPFYESMNVLGSFYIAQHSLSDEDTIYLHADTLCSPSIMREMLDVEGDVIMPVDFGPCDDEAMRVQTYQGRLVRIGKDIPLSESEGEFIGVCKVSARAISIIKNCAKDVLKEGGFSSYFEAAIQGLVGYDEYDVVTMPTGNRFWGEVDFYEDYCRVKANLPDDLLLIAKNWKDKSDKY